MSVRDADDAALAGPPLADEDPAAVAELLLAGTLVGEMGAHPFGQPLLLAAGRLRHLAARHVGADEVLEPRAGDVEIARLRIHLAVVLVAHHQPVFAVIEHEAAVHALDGVVQAALRGGFALLEGGDQAQALGFGGGHHLLHAVPIQHHQDDDHEDDAADQILEAAEPAGAAQLRLEVVGLDAANDRLRLGDLVEHLSEGAVHGGVVARGLLGLTVLDVDEDQVASSRSWCPWPN